MSWTGAVIAASGTLAWVVAAPVIRFGAGGQPVTGSSSAASLQVSLTWTLYPSQLLPCFSSRILNVGLDETFDLGPDDKYRYKETKTDRDELGWEWWSWYGDVDGTKEDHPNNWLLPISSAEYRPVEVRYRGEASTDAARGATNDRGESGYTLSVMVHVGRIRGK